MSLMGWSSAEMATRYQHVTDAIRQDVARRVDGLIWRTRDGAAGDRASAECVLVDPGVLAVILELAEAGLANVGQAAAPTARAAVEQVRALLAGASNELGPGYARTADGEEK